MGPSCSSSPTAFRPASGLDIAPGMPLNLQPAAAAHPSHDGRSSRGQHAQHAAQLQRAPAEMAEEALDVVPRAQVPVPMRSSLERATAAVGPGIAAGRRHYSEPAEAHQPHSLGSSAGPPPEQPQLRRPSSQLSHRPSHQQEYQQLGRHQGVVQQPSRQLQGDDWQLGHQEQQEALTPEPPGLAGVRTVAQPQHAVQGGWERPETPLSAATSGDVGSDAWSDSGENARGWGLWILSSDCIRALFAMRWLHSCDCQF